MIPLADNRLTVGGKLETQRPLALRPITTVKIRAALATDWPPTRLIVARCAGELARAISSRRFDRVAVGLAKVAFDRGNSLVSFRWRHGEDRAPVLLRDSELLSGADIPCLTLW